jgi:prevent-host-death family protein
MEVNIHEAKTHLSQLLLRVSLGEEVTIMKAGKPVARLVPTEGLRARRTLGWAQGEFTVPDDFDVPLPGEIEGIFYQ